MYQLSQFIIGKDSFFADLGVGLGGVLSTVLFKIYIEGNGKQRGYLDDCGWQVEKKNFSVNMTLAI